MPRVVFRCDASPAIGSGHVARCMALARALKARGATVELAARDLPPRVRELLVSDAVGRVHDLEADAAHASVRDEGEPVAHAHWLAVSQRVDARQTIEVLRSGEPADWLIVDQYALDARWERAVRPHVEKLLVIDDLADRDHACDALLDQNFFLEPGSRYASRVPRAAELMLGPKFALLREEFGRERARLAERDGRLRRIFVCFGGFDAAGQTLRALDGIGAAALQGVAVDVVIARDDPQRPGVEARCAAARGWRAHFHVSEVAALMAPADLAIGASGIMSWERAALSLPAIVASVAENQHMVAQDLAADRACIYLGLADAWSAETLAGLLKGLSGTPALLTALAARAGALTDGRGAQRVAARLLPEAIELRIATPADCEDVHRWRNAEENREQAFDSKVIALDEHRRWFERVLADESVALLVGERAGEAIGVLRYDLAGGRATVSVYLVPGAHGRGYGNALIAAGTRWMREHHPQVAVLNAEIRYDNRRSIEAFANAGYLLASHTYTCELSHG